MLKQSSGSVEVFWLDRKATIQAVKRAARRLASARPEIKRIVLFGSLARGDAVPGSDADLLIVLDGSRRRFLDRIPLYYPSGVPIGVDVFAYTEEELARMVEDNNPFIKQALAEGMVIFQRKKP
ncbi:MAG: nucleotidyltransferase domain-containing protein [Chloroflexi bacterium]|nr:nucleotidyltransferase domain-containing protein [Chloroflexota bacterium]